jgi:hypothetical protein
LISDDLRTKSKRDTTGLESAREAFVGGEGTFGVVEVMHMDLGHIDERDLCNVDDSESIAANTGGNFSTSSGRDTVRKVLESAWIARTDLLTRQALLEDRPSFRWFGRILTSNSSGVSTGKGPVSGIKVGGSLGVKTSAVGES